MNKTKLFRCECLIRILKKQRGIDLKPYQKITLIYFIVGASWIFFSDRFFASVTSPSAYISYVQTYKGWFYVLTTALLLFYMTRKMYNNLKEREEEKIKVFYTTMRAVHHILNNFLQKMMYFRLDKIENDLLSEEEQIQYDEMIRATTEQIKKLGEITSINPDEIEKTVYPENFTVNRTSREKDKPPNK
jgi:hypothetical protein